MCYDQVVSRIKQKYASASNVKFQGLALGNDIQDPSSW